MTSIPATMPVSELYRQDELRSLLDRLADGQDVSLVGVSNVGKSDLLRDLSRAETGARLRLSLAPGLRCLYIDCNRMLEWGEQAFYEVILRVLLEEAEGERPDLVPALRRSYDALLNAASSFHIPLRFDEALTTWLETVEGRTILVFDEFDAPFAHLEPRVFLNLRGLKDRYPGALSYVTATDRSLPRLRSDEQVDEVTELFGHAAHYVMPLNADDSRAFIAEQAVLLAATFDASDIAFVLAQAGGHPGLMGIVCRRLAAVTGAVARDPSGDLVIHRQLRDALRSDAAVRLECERIWRDLDGAEQNTLRAIFQPDGVHDDFAFAELRHKGLLRGTRHDPQLFAELFRHFVQQQVAALTASQPEAELGVRLDVESGEVRVDGRVVETLTNLEFRLLLLLYGHLNKICDKYQVVEAVWGEDYIDEVYDSAIDKLVSRLRHKIEPDPANPRFIVTVRGRGYKLVG